MAGEDARPPRVSRLNGGQRALQGGFRDRSVCPINARTRSANMKRPVAIVIAAALAFGSVSVASVGPAAAFSKEDLIQQLSGKSAGAAPQGQQLVVDPNLLKKKRKLPMQQMMIVAPSSGISQPGGKKPMMMIKPTPVITGSGNKFLV